MDKRSVKSQPPKAIIVDYQTLATLMVKHLNIHEGIYRLALEFGPIGGFNGEINGRLMPAAIVPVIGLRLVLDEVLTDLSVDAAVVNPRATLVAMN